MKIAVPADEKNLASDVSMSFGRAAYYLIYDTDAQTGTFIDNIAAASAGGAGIKAAQLIVDSHANVLLTPRCGLNAAEVLKAAEIELYKTEAASIQKNIDAFIAGQLSILEDIHPGYHGQGGK